jgi:outer membrane protein assembly factor BamB
LLLLLGSQPIQADDWPQWFGPNRDGIWREEGLVEKFPPTGPPIRWRTAIGSGYSGPAVTAGKVYVMDRFSLTNGIDMERVICVNEEDGYLYGVCSYGQLRCLKLDTAERIWETFVPVAGKSTRWGTSFIIKNGPRYFFWNELGDLIIAKLSPSGYEEISRTHLLEPLNRDAGRKVVWSHPAFADKSMFVRNDQELIRVDLSAK